MKIAFVMPTPFDLGGEQRVTSIISNILIEQGNDVTIICTNSKVDKDYNIYNLNKKVTIIYTKGKNIKEKCISLIFKALSQVNKKTNLLKKNTKLLEKIYLNRDKYLIKDLSKLINKNKYDYVIGVGGKYSLLLTFLKNEIESKIIGWQHSCYDAYFNTKGRYYWHEDRVFKERISMLDKYIVLTESDKNKIDKNFSIESIVINNPKSFISDEVSRLNSKNFLAAGRFVYVKGYDLLIEAFSAFAKKNKDWTLTIVGEGEEKSKILELIKKYELQDRVKIEGFTNDIKKYMLNASAYLLSSRWEGMPMTILEAYEMGLPIISFNIDAIKELTKDIETGVIVEKYDTAKFAEAMLRMAENESYRKELGKNAKIKSNDFSYERIGEKWKTMLDSL